MRCNGRKVKLHRVGGVFFKSTGVFFVLVWVPEDVRNDAWVRQGGKVDNASVQDIPLYFLFFNEVCCRQKLCGRLTKSRGDNTAGWIA